MELPGPQKAQDPQKDPVTRQVSAFDPGPRGGGAAYPGVRASSRVRERHLGRTIHCHHPGHLTERATENPKALRP
eukprot:8091436-Pyramimonas_sp.AAC.1